MAVFFKVVLRLAVVVLIAVGALFSWVFLYTRDLPHIEHLAEFARDSGNLVTDACQDGPRPTLTQITTPQLVMDV